MLPLVRREYSEEPTEGLGRLTRVHVREEVRDLLGLG